MEERAMNEPTPKWAGFKYEMVPGLANRFIARYLRGQRKNMERFFTQRGLLDSAERMRQIRLSRQGMMAKNAMFQKVLDDYARMVRQPEPEAVQAVPLGEAPAAGSEATDQPSVPTLDTDSAATVEVPSAREPRPDGDGVHARAGVPIVAGEDGAGFVIEE